MVSRKKTPKSDKKLDSTKGDTAKKKGVPKKKRPTSKKPGSKKTSTGMEKSPNKFVSTQSTFPIIAIGASAGGLEAFEIFFKSMPADSGMAFILVAHLDPTHVSLLPELIHKSTKMNVRQITDGVKVDPNSVYVIPPNKDLSILHGTLYLMDLPQPRGANLPIDNFFRSLAMDQGESAICIILSGTGTDGTLGLKVIKGELGMAMVKAMQGRLLIKSELGKGTTASVIIPVVQDVEKLVQPANISQLSSTGHGHILLVDDEESITTLNTIILKNHGFTAEAFNDVTSAIEAVKNGSNEIELHIMISIIII